MHWKPNFFLSQGLICEIQECQCSSYLKPCFVLIGTIFAYGQSSSGKTFTMTGSAMHPGIIKLAVNEIFSRIDKVRLKYGIWWHTDNLCSIVNNTEVQKSICYLVRLLILFLIERLSYWGTWIIQGKESTCVYISLICIKRISVVVFLLLLIIRYFSIMYYMIAVLLWF